MATIEFAPDGINFFATKKGSIEKLWNYFNFNPDIREQLVLNRFAKFRLVNNKIIIAELRR